MLTLPLFHIVALRPLPTSFRVQLSCFLTFLSDDLSHNFIHSSFRTCSPRDVPLGGRALADGRPAVRFEGGPGHACCSDSVHRCAGLSRARLFFLAHLSHLSPSLSALHPERAPTSARRSTLLLSTQPDAQPDANAPDTKARYRAPISAVPPSSHIMLNPPT
jgi:hypothetical protein